MPHDVEGIGECCMLPKDQGQIIRVMPNVDSWFGFVYPTLILMVDSCYRLAKGNTCITFAFLCCLRALSYETV